jgi:hypothetical protein
MWLASAIKRLKGTPSSFSVRKISAFMLKIIRLIFSQDKFEKGKDI